MKRIKIIAFVICIAMMSSGMSSFADPVDSYKEKLSEVESDRKKVERELSKNKQEQRAVADKIVEIEKEIMNTERQIEELFSKITLTKGEISQKKDEIEELKKLIEKQRDLLEKRLRVMYKTSNVEYVEILLSSSDISEFMSNMEMIKNIVAYDKELIGNLKDDREKVQRIKDDLEEKEKSLVVLQRKAEAEKTKLSVSKGKQVAYKQELQENAGELEKQIDKFNEYANRLQSEILKLQSPGKDYGGGVMAWPAPGYSRISSPFGSRYHPILKKNKFHSGIDIAVPRNQKIVAANSGTVIFAGWNGGYGNVVYIDHGGKIVTVYAHNSKLLVKKGDKVQRGQAITKSGSTGMSTGPHLHFEVRKNGKPVNPVNWVK